MKLFCRFTNASIDSSPVWLMLIISLVLICSNVEAQNSAKSASLPTLKLDWEIGPTGSSASFRGISASSANVIWLSGSKSTVLLSLDGGSSWSDVSPNYGELELRSIVSFNERRALVASAGTPAIVLLTEDAGKSWREVYRNDAQAAFFDALKFWDSQRGMAVSDPVEDKFLIITTEDGGLHWKAVEESLLPAPLEGEAFFAASNSSLLLGSNGRAWIGTGGAEGFARVLQRESWTGKWTAIQTPIRSSQSAGLFALNMKDDVALVAVGGDYRPGEASPQVVTISPDQGRSWRTIDDDPKHFRSAVVSVSLAAQSPAGKLKGTAGIDSFWLTVGPTGGDYSWDGLEWSEFSSHGFHALSSIAGHVFAAGANGRFAKLTISVSP